MLRRISEPSTHVSIVPAPDRCHEDKKRLLAFQRHDVSLAELESLIDEAKAVVGLDNQAGAFTHDILCIEMSGPSQPHLTLIDLPGLFQASNKAQSDADAEAVTSPILTYMRKRRSKILAVVSPKNDFANQIVSRYARELDPEVNRTLGIITKPDTLHAGSNNEKAFVELAENKMLFFDLVGMSLRIGITTRGIHQRRNVMARSCSSFLKVFGRFCLVGELVSRLLSLG